MRVIYKYPFNIADDVTITMPSVCQVLAIDHQPGVGPCIWAMVDTDSVPTDNVFHILGTGHPIPDHVERRSGHLATFQQGSFVWHVFGPMRLLRGYC